MAETDVFGYDHLYYFKKEGNEFPKPFVMKYMSRVGLSCRHPILTAGLIKFLVPLFYGDVSVGRFLFTAISMMATLFGLYQEEKEL